MPIASEFLDTQIPQHLADLVSWADSEGSARLPYLASGSILTVHFSGIVTGR